MKCPKCRRENEDGAKFCEECAAPLRRACAKCGRPLSPTAKFCPGCAHPAAPSPETLGRTAGFSSPDSYTPKHLAEKILRADVDHAGSLRPLGHQFEHAPMRLAALALRR